MQKNSDGNIEYLGRIDEQVKIRGYRIEPSEIVKYMSTYPAIKEGAVLPQKDAFGEQRLIAYYIPKDRNGSLNANKLRQYLQKYLPEYMIPTVFLKIDSFPLTANGKLDKAALPLPSLGMNCQYVEPNTTLEKKLAQIWSDELGVQIIGLQDDFFDLGGHSLSAARIISKISSDLNKTVSIYDFYKAANIANLISIIKTTKKNKKKRSLRTPDYRQISNIPLSDFQFLLWMAHTFEPRAQKLNIVGRKRLNGRLNERALEFAFQAVLKNMNRLLISFSNLSLRKKEKIYVPLN